MKIKRILFSIVCLLCTGYMYAGKNNGFAIVVDQVTYNKVQTEIESYAKAIQEKEKLVPIIVIDKWGIPDSIRNELIRLYKQPNAAIEGAVFIGDIPIPMIRDAQHLTSAFKMDQNTFGWHDSSVPSDRFYDDFDLKFTFLKKDKDEPLYFYYSLSPESVQYLQPDLYTGRIKANDENGTTRYEKISAFLKKAVKQKYSQNITDQILFFSGNGYVSESVTARIDEKAGIIENFPWLKHQKNGIEYIDHKRDKAIKYRLKTEMQRPDLDIAILHHHGDVEIQYMNGIPLPKSTTEEIENIKLYLRESLRHAKEKGKDIDSIKVRLSERFGDLPMSWFDGAFEPKVMVEDSLFIRSLDLFIDEFTTYTPNARLVILDACFNGSFHKKQYIAGAYIFNEGSTVAVLGNSVNVLQDKWHDRYVGLMALGMRAGRLSQYNPYLEGHFFGDPTFHFTPITSSVIDVNKALAAGSESFWKKQLKSQYPAVKAMALRQLVDTGNDYSDLLLDTYKASDSYIVRMEAIMLLSVYDNNAFIECLKLAVDDSYELIQRFAINFIAKSGDPRLASAIVSVAIKNNTSERCEFNTKMAMALYPEELLMPEFEKQFANITYYTDRQIVHDAIANSIHVNTHKWKDDLDVILDDSSSVKKKIMCIRMLRNYTLHKDIPKLLSYVERENDETVQIALWEALGWFSLSYQREIIANKAWQVSQDSKYLKAVRDEALKTYYRVKLNKK